MSSHRLTRTRPSVGRVALTASAGLGLLCVVLLVSSAFLGIRPLVVTSGSMSPTIPAGSLVLTRDHPADDAEVGDVVAVAAGSGRVMHRVVSTVPSGADTVLTLQGDANGTPDRTPYVVRDVDMVMVHVPSLGYPVSWLGSPLGLAGLGAVSFGLLMFAFRPGPSRGRGRRRAVALVAAPAVAATILGPTPAAHAWFDDSGTVSLPVATHTVVSQSQPTCTDVDGVLVLGNVARLRWSQVDAKYEYYWELQTTTGTAVATGTVGAGQAVGTTVTLDISTGLIGINANYNVVVRARLTSSTSWVAGTATTTQVRRASILIIGAAMRCGWA
ncbi:MAG TPA: signal peptidase I [Nocardioides sp.]|nr:signal peptidase I [Nocardioides sp.]